MSYFNDPAGPFELTDVSALLNVNVVHTSARWTDARASGVLTPGEAVVLTGSGSAPNSTAVLRRAENGDAVNLIVVVDRVIDIPDPNQGPLSKSPNAVRNQDIPAGEWAMRHEDGTFDLTLVTPDTYKVGEMIGWDLNGTRPASKVGTHEGAWAKNSKADIDSVFEVRGWREVNSTTHEGILTVAFVGRRA